MKRLVALVLCASLATPVAAADLVSFLMPSPLTILLTVGQWIKKDKVEVFYVQVRAHGRDEQDARDQAFRLAVDRAVGSLLLSQTEVRDGEVKRNEIVNYSSGYVQDFRILERYYSNGVTIKIDVWVSRSSIADRLLNESKTEGSVEGGKITEQIRSFQRERQGADRVVEAVLQDYPGRAFDITLGKTGVVMDSNRQPILRIPFRIQWNERFVKAFSEAAMAVNQHPECGGWFDPCINKRLARINGAYFNDEILYQKVFDVMNRSWAKIQIKSPDGTPQFTQCIEVPELGPEWSSWKFVTAETGTIQTNMGRWKDYVFSLDISRLPTDRLDRIEVSIVRPGSCSP